MGFSLLIAIVTVGLVVAISIATHRIVRTTPLLNWHDLLRELEPVRTEEVVALAAGTYPDQMLEDFCTVDDVRQMLGDDGLARLERNADVLVKLAVWTGSWDPYASATAVAKLRRDRSVLRLTSLRLRLRLRYRSHSRGTVKDLNSLSVSYCRMVEGLLLLYKAHHSARLPALAAACNW